MKSFDVEKSHIVDTFGDSEITSTTSIDTLSREKQTWLRKGDEVNVERSDGTIEDGWVILKFSGSKLLGPIAELEKVDEDGSFLRKNVPKDQLYEWNEQINSDGIIDFTEGKITDESNTSTEPARQEQTWLRKGDEVNVERSDGTIEDGWVILKFVAENHISTAVLQKHDSNGDSWEKRVPKDELYQWNPDRQGAASPEKKTFYKEESIQQYLQYVMENRDVIEHSVAQGVELSDVFYDWYSATRVSKYEESDPHTQTLIDEYNKEAIAFLKKIAIQQYRLENNALKAKANNGWLYVQTNKGVPDNGKLGRIYLNIKPESTVSVFQTVAETFSQAKLDTQMKISQDGDLEIFNRADKMVIYFLEGQEEDMLNLLEQIYIHSEDSFEDTGVPMFTANLKTSQGSVMEGVGFGQEPETETLSSFGEIRCNILAEVYTQAKSEGLEVYDSNFDFNTVYTRVCKKYNVDPTNPAFHLNQEDSFTKIRSRISSPRV